MSAHTLPTFAHFTKAARDFKPGDIVRFPKPHGNHEGTRSYWRLRIIEAHGISRYGSPLFQVRDVDSGEVREQGFVSQVMYIEEKKMDNPEQSVKQLSDIVNLKAQWVKDPAWDIENTEGFETYHDELLAWRLARQAMVMSAEDERLERRAASFQCSVELIAYIETLERRLKALEGGGE